MNNNYETAYGRIIEHPITVLEDDASIVYSVFTHVESSCTSALLMCMAICGKLGYMYMLLLHNPTAGSNLVARILICIARYYLNDLFIYLFIKALQHKC